MWESIDIDLFIIRLTSLLKSHAADFILCNLSSFRFASGTYKQVFKVAMIPLCCRYQIVRS